MRRVATLSIFMATALTASSTTLDKMTITSQKEANQHSLIRDLPNETAGVDLKRTAGKIDEITIRGIGGENISVTGAGTSTHGACPNRMDPPLAHINSSKVKKIEVIKGPFSVEDAGVFAGSANVIFKDLPTANEFEANAAAASYDRYDMSVTGGGVSGNFGVRVGAERHEAGVYKDGKNRYLTDVGASPKYKDGIKNKKLYEKEGAFIQAGYKNEDFRTILEFDYIDTDHALFPTRKMDDTKTETTQIAATVEATSGALDGTKLKLYRSYVDHIMDNHTFRTPPMKTDAKGDSTTVGLRLSKKFDLDTTALTVGADYSTREWDIGRFDATTGVLRANGQMIDTKTTMIGAFAKAEIAMKENCDLEVGLRADQVELKDNNSNTNNAIKTAGINYKSKNSDTLIGGYLKRTQKLDDNLKLIVQLGTAQRTITGSEAFIQQFGTNNTLGNPHLKSPRNTQLDIGASFDDSSLKVKGNLFYSMLTDYIYEKKHDAGNKTYTNIDASIYGAELQASYKLTESLTFKTNLAYQEGKKEKADNGSKNLAEMPPLRYKLHALYSASGLKTSLEFEGATKDSKNDTALGETDMKSYLVTNLRAEYDLKNGFGFLAGVENITDEHYAQYNSYSPDPVNSSTGEILYEAGRVFYAAMKYRF